jgi:hypothetical protein
MHTPMHPPLSVEGDCYRNPRLLGPHSGSSLLLTRALCVLSVLPCLLAPGPTVTAPCTLAWRAANELITHQLALDSLTTTLVAVPLFRTATLHTDLFIDACYYHHHYRISHHHRAPTATTTTTAATMSLAHTPPHNLRSATAAARAAASAAETAAPLGLAPLAAVPAAGEDTTNGDAPSAGAADNAPDQGTTAPPLPHGAGTAPPLLVGGGSPLETTPPPSLANAPPPVMPPVGDGNSPPITTADHGGSNQAQLAALLTSMGEGNAMLRTLLALMVDRAATETTTAQQRGSTRTTRRGDAPPSRSPSSSPEPDYHGNHYAPLGDTRAAVSAPLPLLPAGELLPIPAAEADKLVTEHIPPANAADQPHWPITTMQSIWRRLDRAARTALNKSKFRGTANLKSNGVQWIADVVEGIAKAETLAFSAADNAAAGSRAKKATFDPSLYQRYAFPDPERLIQRLNTHLAESGGDDASTFAFMRAEFVREYMGDVTSADIVADLKGYCVAEGTTFQSALRDLTNRISAARATYTSAPDHEREMHDASIKHALQRFASRQYPELLGVTVTDAYIRAHSLDAILDEWSTKKRLNASARAPDTNAKVTFPIIHSVFVVQDATPPTSTTSGRANNSDQRRDPLSYPKGVWNKVHYACGNTGTAGCFNCSGAHAYPACTALFTGAETFTANAKKAVATGAYKGNIEALPRSRGYFDDCRTTYDLYFKGKSTATTTNRSAPPEADIAALATRLRADFEARRK